MNIPRLMAFFVLVFWGWQINATYLGIALGLLLEAGGMVSRRGQIAEADYRRAWDFSCILGACAALYCFVVRNDENMVARGLSALDWRPYDATTQVHSALYFSQWWPLILLPFGVLAFWGDRRQHEYATFFWLMRRSRTFGQQLRGRVDGRIGFLVISVLSASAVLPGSNAFYLGLMLVAGWFFWLTRSRRSSVFLWIALAGLAGWSGYWGHRGLNALQGRVEAGVAAMTDRLMNKKTNAMRNHTAIGRIGELKLSGRIVCYVDMVRGREPSLLREAVYTGYWAGQWNAGRGRNLVRLPAADNNTTWTVDSSGKNDSEIRIRGFLGDFMPAVPLGLQRFRDLPALEVRRNAYGSVKVEGGSGYRDFRVLFGDETAGRWPPLETDSGSYEDLQLPDSEQRAISQIAADLHLRDLSFERKLLAIQNYFSAQFSYSTYQSVAAVDLPKGTSVLAHFLQEGRSGHCEFFATATVLLLREAGVPARYVIGYALNETDSDGSYVVRERHGHAWTTCWDKANNRWIDFDTTPASGFEIDEKEASAFEGLRDFCTQVRYALTEGWRTIFSGPYRFILWLVGAIGLIFIMYRVLRGRREAIKPVGGPAATDVEYEWPGADSEFFDVEKHLETAGYSRWPNEQLSEWRDRISKDADIDIGAFDLMVALHERYRFDPSGISTEERALLTQQAAKVEVYFES